MCGGKNKGPIPFGAEPSASDFAMLVLFVYNVSIVPVQFSIASSQATSLYRTLHTVHTRKSPSSPRPFLAFFDSARAVDLNRRADSACVCPPCGFLSPHLQQASLGPFPILGSLRRFPCYASVRRHDGSSRWQSARGQRHRAESLSVQLAALV